MAQLSFLPEDPPTPAAHAARATRLKIPSHRPTDSPSVPPEGREQYRARRDAALAAADRCIADSMPVLEAFRSAAAKHFGRISAGKTFKRSPGHKVTIPAPATEEKPEARLIVQPHTNSSGWKGDRKVTVDANTIDLTYCQIRPNRHGEHELREELRLRLSPGGTHRILMFHPDEVEADAARIVALVADFLDDPVAVVAQSGTHCFYCTKLLTDPQSRARGIGPECYQNNGDFVAWIREATRQLAERTTDVVIS